MKPSSQVALPAIHDPVIVLDADWRVIQANEPAGRAYGAEPVALEGRLVWDVLPGGARHPVAAALHEARAGGGDILFEERETASGRRFEYRIYVQADTLTVLRTEAPERPEPGHPAMTNPSAGLGDEFIAIVSHELRAPLNAILGWAGLLRDGGLDPQMTQHAVDVIERNARAQAELITDLLDLSRLLAGRLPLAHGPVDLVLVLRSAVDAVRTAASGKEITLRTGPLPDACMLQGDGDRLQQAMVTLLLNAFKGTPAGGEVAITLLTSEGRAEVRVADTGTGVPPADLPYLFERAPRERSAGGRHGGVGLALVRHLVEAHHGRVEALSAGLGQGTTIVVHLPCGDA